MAIEGELTGKVELVTCGCGARLPLEVCVSGGGYYVGRMCSRCGPYSRETDYVQFEESAVAILADIQGGVGDGYLRDTNYNGR